MVVHTLAALVLAMIAARLEPCALAWARGLSRRARVAVVTAWGVVLAAAAVAVTLASVIRPP